MITQRSVFKNPLCPNCTMFERTVLGDGVEIVRCDSNKSIPLTPGNLAKECNMYVDILKDKYWELLEKQTREIHIIGQKVIKAGFKVEKE